MRIAFTLAALLALACPAAGQDTAKHELKAYKPKAGDRTKVTETETSDLTITVTANGTTKAVPVGGSKTTAYTEHVEAVGDDGKPARFTRTYTVARTGGAKPVVRGYEGKTVAVARGADKRYTFTVDGKPAADADAQDLDQQFNRPEKAKDDDMLPRGAVKTGESWAIDGKVLIAAFGGAGMPITFDAARATAKGTLTRAYPKDGRRYGVVTTTVNLPATEMKLGANAVPLDATSAMTVVATTDTAIDGASPFGSFAAVITVKMDARAADTMSMAGTLKTAKTVERP